jgi:ribosomal protein S18 acetylase RimI-like enzyme
MTEGEDLIRVERATVEDAVGIRLVIRAAMAKYVRDSGIPGQVDALGEDVLDLMRYITENAVFVARVGRNIVGTVRLSLEADAHAYLSRFAVLPGNQSKGVGSMLFEAAEQYLQTQGVRSVRLHTALTNTPLVRFYENRGFRLAARSDERGYPRGLLIKEFDPPGGLPPESVTPLLPECQ